MSLWILFMYFSPGPTWTLMEKMEVIRCDLGAPAACLQRRRVLWGEVTCPVPARGPQGGPSYVHASVCYPNPCYSKEPSRASCINSATHTPKAAKIFEPVIFKNHTGFLHSSPWQGKPFPEIRRWGMSQGEQCAPLSFWGSSQKVPQKAALSLIAAELFNHPSMQGKGG